MKASGEAQAKGKAGRVVAGAAAVLVALLAAAGVWAYASGALYPADAAAKYGMFDYLPESEVSDYVMTYKEQMGYGDAGASEEWAEFLASYNLTPDRLRFTTITQILTDTQVERRARDLGITVSDAEVDAALRTLKDTYGLGSEQTWRDTLELYGQSEEGLDEAYRKRILKQKLCTAEVGMPAASDDDVRSQMGKFASARKASLAEQQASSELAAEIANDGQPVAVRHSYCFEYAAADGEIGLEDSEHVEALRSRFIESGATVEGFAALVASETKGDGSEDAGGDKGWDADRSGYGEVYVRMLDSTGTGLVSPVFTEGDRACFIWVDQAFYVPSTEEGLAALDLDAMPASLRGYFADLASYELWDAACDEYLAQLAADMDVTVYPMPADVPYNVDMSPYLVAGE